MRKTRRGLDKWIVRVLRSLGGTWEDWEDQLTLERFIAIIKSEEEIPPVYVTAYLVGVSLGAIAPPKATGTDKAPPGTDFLAAFGTSGTMTGGM